MIAKNEILVVELAEDENVETVEHSDPLRSYHPEKPSSTAVTVYTIKNYSAF